MYVIRHRRHSNTLQACVDIPVPYWRLQVTSGIDQPWQNNIPEFHGQQTFQAYPTSPNGMVITTLLGWVSKEWDPLIKDMSGRHPY